MDKVQFANGIEMDCGFCGQPTQNILYVTLTNTSYVEAATIFSNPENIKSITFKPSVGDEITFNGYTIFEYLVNESNGFRASLRIPYITEV